jgi:hypothetical protein
MEAITAVFTSNGEKRNEEQETWPTREEKVALETSILNKNRLLGLKRKELEQLKTKIKKMRREELDSQDSLESLVAVKRERFVKLKTDIKTLEVEAEEASVDLKRAKKKETAGKGGHTVTPTPRNRSASTSTSDGDTLEERRNATVQLESSSGGE